VDTGSEHREPRRRDAAATRESLLDAARRLVAEHGVEGTSTRDVAAVAGVNQALVYRYFGSKEKLFAEAVEGTMRADDNLVLDTPLPDLPRALLERALESAAGSNGYSTLVAVANDERIRAVIRDRIDTAFGTQLAARLDGPDAVLRAELLAALITGIGVLRGKIGTRAISAATVDDLAGYVDLMVAPLFTAAGEPA
jgi:AcrR family transcriptional regulator